MPTESRPEVLRGRGGHLGVGLVETEGLEVLAIESRSDVRVRVVPPPPELVPQLIVVLLFPGGGVASGLGW